MNSDQRSAVSGQRSAKEPPRARNVGSGQQSAVSDQRSAVSGQREEREIYNPPGLGEVQIADRGVQNPPEWMTPPWHARLVELARAVCEVAPGRGARNDEYEGLALDLRGFLNEAAAAAEPAGKCRVCGCTQDDCSDCVEQTGEPCHWVEPDLCSRCADPERPPVFSEVGPESADAPDTQADAPQPSPVSAQTGEIYNPPRSDKQCFRPWCGIERLCIDCVERRVVEINAELDRIKRNLDLQRSREAAAEPAKRDQHSAVSDQHSAVRKTHNPTDRMNTPQALMDNIKRNTTAMANKLEDCVDEVVRSLRRTSEGCDRIASSYGLTAADSSAVASAEAEPSENITPHAFGLAGTTAPPLPATERAGGDAAEPPGWTRKQFDELCVQLNAKPEPAGVQSWQCDDCGAVNNRVFDYCGSCRKHKPIASATTSDAPAAEPARAELKADSRQPSATKVAEPAGNEALQSEECRVQSGADPDNPQSPITNQQSGAAEPAGVQAQCEREPEPPYVDPFKEPYGVEPAVVDDQGPLGRWVCAGCDEEIKGRRWVHCDGCTLELHAMLPPREPPEPSSSPLHESPTTVHDSSDPAVMPIASKRKEAIPEARSPKPILPRFTKPDPIDQLRAALPAREQLRVKDEQIAGLRAKLERAQRGIHRAEKAICRRNETIKALCAEREAQAC